MKKSHKILLPVSGVLTGVICAVMNFALIPKIELTTKPLRCFDMSFAYSFDTASDFLSRLTEEGRGTYLHLQLPLDFVYPLVYCAFFCLLLVFLLKKKTVLLALPVALAAFDYAENVTVLLMLRAVVLSPTLVSFGSAFTSTKTVLMYACFLVILICAVYRIKRAKRREACCCIFQTVVL